jgi:hypothetical protein
MKTLFPIAAIGFVAVTFIYIGILIYWLRQGINNADLTVARKRKIFSMIVFCLGAWTVLISILSWIGFYSDFTTFPPKFFMVVIIPLIVLIWTTTRPTTAEILQHIPAHRIVYLQSFRVFVEILLWMLFVDNLLPIQMTFEGYNLDVFSGLTAPIIGFMIRKNKSRGLMIIWNVLCLGLLINIVTIAIVSTPTPLRIFMNEPANTIVTRFPIIWLPGLLVPLAYTLHILSLRQALRSRTTGQPSVA